VGSRIGSLLVDLALGGVRLSVRKAYLAGVALGPCSGDDELRLVAEYAAAACFAACRAGAFQNPAPRQMVPFYEESRMKPFDSVQTIVAEATTEEERVTAMMREASEQETPLYVGRFLTDFSDSEVEPLLEDSPWIAVKQFGQTCWVNAQPPLADAYRAELGLKDARKAIESDQYGTVVLSQVLGAVCDNLITSRDIEELVGACPADRKLVLTGDRMPKDLKKFVGKP
jgi:hypothetical protein